MGICLRIEETTKAIAMLNLLSMKKESCVAKSSSSATRIVKKKFLWTFHPTLRTSHWKYFIASNGWIEYGNASLAKSCHCDDEGTTTLNVFDTSPTGRAKEEKNFLCWKVNGLNIPLFYDPRRSFALQIKTNGFFVISASKSWV